MNKKTIQALNQVYQADKQTNEKWSITQEHCFTNLTPPQDHSTLDSELQPEFPQYMVFLG